MNVSAHERVRGWIGDVMKGESTIEVELKGETIHPWKAEQSDGEQTITTGLSERGRRLRERKEGKGTKGR